jgi:hypothetical protein
VLRFPQILAAMPTTSPMIAPPQSRLGRRTDKNSLKKHIH